MLYFRGCTAREKMPQIEEATRYILDKAEIEYKTLENEGCCGSVLLRTGFKEDAKKQMKENIEKLKPYKDETIITSCSGCYKTLKDDYKEILNEDRACHRNYRSVHQWLPAYCIQSPQA